MQEMKEHEKLLMTLLQGGSFGFLGLVVGLMFVNSSLTINVMIRYTVVALISGSIAFYSVGLTIYSQHNYLAAILAGWIFFFFGKGFMILLVRFSLLPHATIKEATKIISDVKQAIKGKK